MKKPGYNLAVWAPTLMVWLFGLVFGLGSPLNVQAASAKQKAPPPIYIKTLNGAYGAPVELRIPKIGVKAKIEHRGVNQNGALVPPKNPKQVAWFRNGPKPGSNGNAVISGHVDWYDGPAVFYRLRQLKRGDIVEVVNDREQVSRFIVIKTVGYYNGSIPLKQITGPSNKKLLNLITCSGAWDPKSKNYSHRLVVYTELVK